MATYNSGQSDVFATSPFEDEISHTAGGYVSRERRAALSDRWTFFFTVVVENLFSAIAGGLVWISVVVVFAYFLVSSFWVGIFSISSVEQAITSRNLGEAFAALSFVIAFITSNQITRRIKVITTPIRLYREMVMAIQRLHEDFHAVYRSQVLDFQKKVRLREGQLDEQFVHDMKVWLDLVGDTFRSTATVIQLLNLWALRIFLQVDNVLDYTDFGITELEIHRSIELPKKSYGMLGNDPIDISIALIRKIKQAIQGASTGLSDNTPKPTNAQTNLLQTSLNNLEERVVNVRVNHDVRIPTILNTAENVVLAIFLVVLIPIVIYSAIDIFTLIICPIVLFLYSMTLIFSWYIGSAFEEEPRWIGPDFFKWRRDLYRSIYYDERRETEWIERGWKLLQTYELGEDVSGMRIIDKDEIGFFSHDREDMNNALPLGYK